MKPHTEAEHRQMIADLRDANPQYPVDRFSGRGIVICGGGMKLYTCAWVCINMIRHFGCKLPIELWHLGQREMSQVQKQLIEKLGVKTVDAHEVRKTHPVRILNGWELKPYAIINSAFEEVMLLDADNVVVRNPEYLFDAAPYQARRAAFWPDFGRLGRMRKIWDICGVPYEDEPEFESGQILVDKNACWKPLAITMHLNEHSDFFYKHIHGDKETFHMGWKIAGQNYAMPERGIQRLHCTMCQHDFEGERVFQHRNLDKWSLARGANPRIRGFEHEDLCFQFVDELRQAWAAGGWSKPTTEAEKEAVQRLVAHRWHYHRVGHDHRPMEFEEDGRIGEGRAGCEARWNISTDEDGLILRIIGRDAETAHLRLEADTGHWRGAWIVHEKMPCELLPKEHL